MPNTVQLCTQSPNVFCKTWMLDQKATLKAMADRGDKTQGFGFRKPRALVPSIQQTAMLQLQQGYKLTGLQNCSIAQKQAPPPDLSAMKQSEGSIADAQPNVMHGPL